MGPKSWVLGPESMILGYQILGSYFRLCIYFTLCQFFQSEFITMEVFIGQIFFQFISRLSLAKVAIHSKGLKL